MEKDRAVRVESVASQLYQILSEELAYCARRVDYSELAKRLGCARSTVRYNVGKLLRAGLIDMNEHGKLCLPQKDEA